MAAPTIVTGILTGGSNNHATSSEEVNGVSTDFVSEGVVGTFTNTSGVAPATGAFAVNASGSPDTNINISTGVAYVTGTPTSQNSQTLRVKCSVTGTLAISANASGSTKYDWIYIKLDATKMANPAVGADDVATVVASRSSSASTDDGTPPTYSYPIAVVTVANGFATITNANIRDVRTNSTVNLGSSSVSSGWLDLGYTPNTVTYNGNRSYSLVYNSVDLTSTVSPGMRLKHTRLVTAPTQCTSLNGTTQYYSKTSPSAMTFTDDFVVSAWVKLSSYPATNWGTIASRYNGTSGWRLYVDTSGAVQLAGLSGGAANFSRVISYQSVPLNKWVHITAQLDMSAFTATTTTSYVMIDGVDVPASVSRGGTNPTALIQAGDLQIGTDNTLQFFPGKIAQVAIYNAKVTQANVRATMSQGLSGSETSLISAYSFNNSINDLNANANNLTANGSAVATSADSPFSINSFGTATGTTDYGIITAATFSTNTTLTVQVPEGNTIPTTGGVSAVSYSTGGVSYGLPKDTGRWAVELIVLAVVSTSGTTVNTTYNPGGLYLNVPVGRYYLEHDLTTQVSTNAATIDAYTTLSTSSSAFNNGSKYNSRFTIQVTSSTSANIWPTHKSDFVNLSTATPYYILLRSVSAFTALAVRGDTTANIGEASVIRAVLADL